MSIGKSLAIHCKYNCKYAFSFQKGNATKNAPTKI